MKPSATRRGLLRLLAACGAVAGLARSAAALVPTPSQTAGPFYPPPEDRLGDDDWNLVKVAGKVREAGGEVMHLSGRVLDAGGEPVPGAIIEIWQCDAKGVYLDRDDRRGADRDPYFQGFGATRSDGEGGYRFRTIRPVPYPGRTPHIHARVIRPDGSELITQIYLEGHPLNQSDFVFRRLGAKAREAASISPARRGDGDLEAAFDFVV
jgi:protocatechuate 3,4-dioxygenase beta subunit